MAKPKTNNNELDKKLKAAEELIETCEALISKFQSLPFLDKENTQELKKHMTSIKKLKESLGQEAPNETKKKIDQIIERLRTLSQEKQKAAKMPESEKNKTLDALNGVIKSLNNKANELRSQLEGGQSKKKGKGQSKNEKVEKGIENLLYHVSKLEEVRKQYEIDGLVEQDQTLKEVITYFEDYLDNSEYQQQKQTSYIDGLYESFEKEEENEEVEQEITTTTTANTTTTVKEVERENMVVSEAQDAEKKSFMARIRQRGFEHETKRMPNISEKDIKPEYNFFGAFEASARNIPQESDYYPNASTKERISTKEIYPKRKLVGEHIFERFDVDTLFFIFYFQKDTYEQHLAAKELKKRAWRFHKKYLTWFKRLEAPRVTNDDYEQGTYAFFDFEPGGWCQRRKSDFTFKYSYLEDDKL